MLEQSWDEGAWRWFSRIVKQGAGAVFWGLNQQGGEPCADSSVQESVSQGCTSYFSWTATSYQTTLALPAASLSLLHPIPWPFAGPSPGRSMLLLPHHLSLCPRPFQMALRAAPPTPGHLTSQGPSCRSQMATQRHGHVTVPLRGFVPAVRMLDGEGAPTSEGPMYPMPEHLRVQPS